ncbi:TatD family hydrolase [Galactobacter sp.]|uniref:TatD family hydrolase n=1 Tax=Galactobacter sp. TaxID=2676125 RepID=UPI0025B97EA7|nr:TatD family hydrolase [Galactobacter sp.]
MPDSAQYPPVVPGETPPAYLPREEDAPSDAEPGTAEPGTGPSDTAAPQGIAATGRSTKGEDGRRRKLVYPPAPEPLPVPVVDNHTHLDFRDGLVEVSAADALDAAAAVGVEGVIQVGCDVESSRWAVQAANRHPRMLAAVAIHPNDAARSEAKGTLLAELAEIDRLAEDPRVRAIGETGLDYFRTGEDGRDAQQASFRAHLAIAARRGLPVQIHDRDAHDDVIRILDEEGFSGTVVFHCFSGDEDMAELAHQRGWYLSFGGTSTFKNNDTLRAALGRVDLDHLLVETDAPFLTAVPYRGRPNAPYLIPLAVRALAEELDVDLAAFCERIRANTRRVYGDF